MDPEVVLVTGCVSGLGLATAVLLAQDPEQRYIVIATVISVKEQDELVVAMGTHLDRTAHIMEMDLTNDEQIQGVVNSVMKRFGRIDILMNIAGIGTCGYMDTMSRSKIEQAFNINAVAVIRLTQAVLPHMKKKRRGKILTVTSRGGRTGIPLLEVYCASKFAVEGFFESLVPVSRQFNVDIVMVEPGALKTQLQQNIFAELEAVVADDSVNDLDRSFARNWLDGVKKNPATMTPSEAAPKLVEMIRKERPCLRYTLPEKLGDEIAKILGDPSGEIGIALNENRILS